MLGVGLIIVIAAIVGFLAICRKRQTKCWTGIFMVLTLLVLCMSVIFTGVGARVERSSHPLLPLSSALSCAEAYEAMYIS